MKSIPGALLFGFVEQNHGFANLRFCKLRGLVSHADGKSEHTSKRGNDSRFAKSAILRQQKINQVLRAETMGTVTLTQVPG